jgi:Cu/Zn superoxide dismutase
VVNRVLVIHQLKDDLGLTNITGSISTGNSGTRVACGLIQEEYQILPILILPIGPLEPTYNKAGLSVGTPLKANALINADLIKGQLTIAQNVGSLATLTLEISGLVAGSTHGWVNKKFLMQHIHRDFAMSPCSASGPHFNPYNVAICHNLR